MSRNFGEEGARLSYGSYLKVPELLDLQVLLSDPPAHDELLFIIVHQAYELWFKAVIFELESVRARLDEQDLVGASHLLARVHAIEGVMIEHIKVLESMSPQDFLEFRHNLAPASGFQSVQFREIEFISGLKDERYLDRLILTDDETARLRRRLSEPTLWDAFCDLLSERGLPMPEGDPDVRMASLQAIAGDRDKYGDLFGVSEDLLEHDERFAKWRYHHVLMVERQIGTKSGTGGSAGAPYLRSTLDKRFYPELLGPAQPPLACAVTHTTAQFPKYLDPGCRIGTTEGQIVDQRAFRRVIERQHGVFTYTEAAARGIDSNRLRRMLGAGEVARMLPGVYRITGAPRSFTQVVAAACKWAGPDSAVSHQTAAWMLGLGDLDETRVDVTTHRRLRSPNSRIVVHRRAQLQPRELSRVKGIQVTTMPRTVIDLAAVCGEEVVDIALDSAIRMGMRRNDLTARLDELAMPGRNGIALVRRLVAERVAEQGLTESPFERRLLRALRRAKLPLPVCQYVIGDGEFSARVDFAYPERGLVIEADSYRWHDGRAAWERDRARVSELASRGWRVLLITWLQLKYKLDDVIRRIERSLEASLGR